MTDQYLSIGPNAGAYLSNDPSAGEPVHTTSGIAAMEPGTLAAAQLELEAQQAAFGPTLAGAVALFGGPAAWAARGAIGRGAIRTLTNPIVDAGLGAYQGYQHGGIMGALTGAASGAIASRSVRALGTLASRLRSTAKVGQAIDNTPRVMSPDIMRRYAGPREMPPLTPTVEVPRQMPPLSETVTGLPRQMPRLIPTTEQAGRLVKRAPTLDESLREALKISDDAPGSVSGFPGITQTATGRPSIGSSWYAQQPARGVYPRSVGQSVSTPRPTTAPTPKREVVQAGPARIPQTPEETVGFLRSVAPDVKGAQWQNPAFRRLVAKVGEAEALRQWGLQ